MRKILIIWFIIITVFLTVSAFQESKYKEKKLIKRIEKIEHRLKVLEKKIKKLIYK